MNEHTSGPSGEASDEDRKARDQDIHPALDPREPSTPEVTAPMPDAPALDIDDREDDHVSTPDVIALPDVPEATIDDEGDCVPTPDVIPLPEVPDTTVDEAEDHTALPEAIPVPEVESESDNENAPNSADPDSEPGQAAGLLGGLTARFRRRSDDAGAAPGRRVPLADTVRSYVDFRIHMLSTVPHRWIAGLVALLVLVFLLANSGGLAVIALSCLAPLLIVVTLTQHDVFEKESNPVVAGVAGAGFLAGIVLSALGAMIHYRQWFDDGVLYYGAGGFGGRFAEAAGTAPLVVWLFSGIALPAVALAVIGGIPIALRRWPQFRNEVMDGVILGGATAAGIAIGASVVYWWPMIATPGPATSVSDWTLAVVGVAILRSATITLCGAMVGACIWRYMTRESMWGVLEPAVGGFGGYAVLALGSISFQPAGLWQEMLLTLAVLATVFVMYRRTLDQAVEEDKRALGTASSRIVCPACRKITPMGKYCAHCGEHLQEPAPREVPTP